MNQFYIIVNLPQSLKWKVFYMFTQNMVKSSVVLALHLERTSVWCLISKVHYICGSLLLLRVESRDFSQAEKERIACKAEQIHKMTTIFTQNGPRLSFWVKMADILWICSALEKVLFFSAWEKSSDSTRNSRKLEDM